MIDLLSARMVVDVRAHSEFQLGEDLQAEKHIDYGQSDRRRQGMGALINNGATTIVSLL